MFAKKTGWIIFVLWILVLFASGATQDNLPGIAVLPLEGNGISAPEALVLTDELRSVLVKSGKYNVVERSNMESILQEQGFQLSGCTSTECAVEAGKLLGVNKMVTGSVGKLGELFNITVRLFDVGSGRIEKSSSQKHEGSVEELLEVIHSVALELSVSDKDMSSVEMSDTKTQYTGGQRAAFPISAHRAGLWFALVQPRTSMISKTGNGFGFGIYYRMPVIENLLIQPELSYSTAEIEYYEPTDILRFEYFNISALFCYEVNPPNFKDFYISLNAGAAMNSTLGAEEDYENYVSDLKDQTEGTSLSFIFGVGAGLRLGRILVILEGRYHSNTSNIFINDTDMEVGKWQGFSFMAGIAF